MGEREREREREREGGREKWNYDSQWGEIEIFLRSSVVLQHCVFFVVNREERIPSEKGEGGKQQSCCDMSNGTERKQVKYNIKKNGGEEKAGEAERERASEKG